MNNTELVSLIITVLVAVAVRVIDHYWPGLAHVRPDPDTDEAATESGRHAAGQAADDSVTGQDRTSDG